MPEKKEKEKVRGPLEKKVCSVNRPEIALSSKIHRVARKRTGSPCFTCLDLRKIQARPHLPCSERCAGQICFLPGPVVKICPGFKREKIQPGLESPPGHRGQEAKKHQHVLFPAMFFFRTDTPGSSSLPQRRYPPRAGMAMDHDLLAQFRPRPIRRLATTRDLASVKGKPRLDDFGREPVCLSMRTQKHPLFPRKTFFSQYLPSHHDTLYPSPSWRPRKAVRAPWSRVERIFDEHGQVSHPVHGPSIAVLTDEGEGKRLVGRARRNMVGEYDDPRRP